MSFIASTRGAQGWSTASERSWGHWGQAVTSRPPRASWPRGSWKYRQVPVALGKDQPWRRAVVLIGTLGQSWAGGQTRADHPTPSLRVFLKEADSAASCDLAFPSALKALLTVNVLRKIPKPGLGRKVPRNTQSTSCRNTSKSHQIIPLFAVAQPWVPPRLPGGTFTESGRRPAATSVAMRLASSPHTESSRPSRGQETTRASDNGSGWWDVAGGEQGRGEEKDIEHALHTPSSSSRWQEDSLGPAAQHPGRGGHTPSRASPLPLFSVPTRPSGFIVSLIDKGTS